MADKEKKKRGRPRKNAQGEISAKNLVEQINADGTTSKVQTGHKQKKIDKIQKPVEFADVPKAMFDLKLKVVSVQVVISRWGTDTIYINLAYPNPQKHLATIANMLTVTTFASRFSGAEYVRKHFGIEPTVIHEKEKYV